MEKKLRKLLSLAIALVMVLSMLPGGALRVYAESVGVEAEDAEIEYDDLISATGTCGESLNWTLTNGGKLTISGTGDMADYSFDEIPWYNDKLNVSSVEIEQGVTSIGSSAFYQCENLVSINIADTVRSIGANAFTYCTALADIVLPDGLESIGNHAFTYCYNLGRVTIPSSVSSIGRSAFLYCSILDGVWVDEGNEYYTSDANGALYDKEKTTLLKVPDALYGAYAVEDGTASIGWGALRGCYSLDSVIIPDSVTNIDYYAFYDCSSLEDIKIPESVTSIGKYVFSGCSSLKNIEIPYGVDSIGGSTFCYCGELTSITIPVTVTSIGSLAFYDCVNLTDVYYGGTEEQWAQIDIGSDNEYLTNATIYYVGESEPSEPVACEHTPGEPVTEEYVAATCTEAGYYTVTTYCTLCGEPISGDGDEIPATGHTPGESVKENVVEATAATDGSYDSVAYCSVCSDELSRETVSVSATGVIAYCEHCCCDVVWTAWDGTAASGHYFLAEDVILTSQVEIDAETDMTLDLNGYSITAVDVRAFYVNGWLSIVDSATGGTIVGNGAYATSNVDGGVIYVSGSNAVWNMYSGTVEMTAEHNTIRRGGVAYITGGATANLYGGTITGGVSDERGGNITVVSNSYLNIFGGEITGGSPYNMYIGTGTHTITGGIITGKTAVAYASAFTVAGVPVIENLDLINGTLITLGELSEGASIGVTADGVFTEMSANAADYLAYFYACDAEKQIIVTEAALAVADLSSGDINEVYAAAVQQTADGVFASGETVIATCPYCGESASWSALEANTSGASKTLSVGHYYLAEDMENTGLYYIADGSVCVHLNGHDINATGARVFFVESSGTLNVMGDGQVCGSYKASSSNPHFAVTIDSVGHVNLCGGTWLNGGKGATLGGRGTSVNGIINIYEGTTIDGENADHGYALVSVYQKTTLNIYGGTITGGVNASGNGGNICMKANTYSSRKSNLHIYGGTISNGSAALGGNIYAEGGTSAVNVNIAGGTITGGSVYVDSNVTNLFVSGMPVIENLDLINGTLITLGELSEGASIGVTADGVFTEMSANAADYLAYFYACDAEKQIIVTEAALAVADLSGGDTAECAHVPGEPVTEEYVAATCTEAGYYTVTTYCTLCGEPLSGDGDEIPATGHTPGEPVKENVVEATVATDGSYDSVVYCSVCGDELSRETVSVPALTGSLQVTLTPSATTVHRGDEITVVVSVSGDSELTSMGYIPTLSDAYQVTGGEVLATGTAISQFDPVDGGTLAYTSAKALCGEVFAYTVKISDDADFGEYLLTGRVSVKNGENTVNVTLSDAAITVVCKHDDSPWSNDGESHSRSCSICGDVQTAEHTWDEGQVTVEPTYQNVGEVVYTCTCCGASYTEELPKLEYLTGDFTGDGTVTDADAMYLLRHVLFPERYPENQPQDMNGDGIVTDADAVYLLRHVLFPDMYPLP